MSYFGHSDHLPEWTNQIPEGWGTNWLKWSVELSTKRASEEEKETLPYISNEDIASWTGKLLIDEPYPVQADSRIFRANDILFNKLRPYLAKVYLATFDGACSTELLCLRPTRAVKPRFLFYVLVSKDFIGTINAATYGAKMPRADWEIVGHQPLPLPPINVQCRIVRLLDEKIERIGALIDKKRELLDRLAEKRQALITRAVTEGLRAETTLKTEHLSDYSLKDRGAAGEVGRMNDLLIPLGWSSKKLKYLATYNDEVLPENTSEEKEIDYVEISGISLSRGIEEIQRMPFGSAPSRARRKVRSGDILISTVRTYLRAIAKIDHASPDLIVSTGFSVVRPNEDVDSGYLGWAVKSERFVSEVVARSVGVSYPAINSSELVNIEMPLPALDKQRRIARFLDEEAVRVDELAVRIGESIERLEEYRSALIAACVTGQVSDQR